VLRAGETAFSAVNGAEERAIAELICEHWIAETVRLEQEVFAQRAHLADADRQVGVTPTKAPAESKCIATTKVDQSRARGSNLK
jgi:hypothetical protein